MEWLIRNWPDVLQNLGIITGLFATAYTWSRDRRERLLQTEFELVAGHRNIWSALRENPALARILDTSPDLVQRPVSLAEELQVRFVILHARAAFKAHKAGMKFADDNVELDTRLFFRLPIPFQVWNQSRKFYDAEFVSFVENCLKRT